METIIQLMPIPFMVKISMATFVGYVIGLEREAKAKPAGIKTYGLICLGAAIFTHISLSIPGIADPSRVAAQIVSGLGFIGAGAIFQSKRIITGLTTAASMWVVGALGTLIGLEFYFETLFTLTIIFIYFLFSRITHNQFFKLTRYTLEISVNSKKDLFTVDHLIKKSKLGKLKFSWIKEHNKIKVDCTYVTTPSRHNELVNQIQQLEVIEGLRVN